MGCFSAASSSTKASLTTLASRSIVRRCRGTSAAQAADVHVISRDCQTVAELQHSVPCLHFGHVQLHDDLWLSAHLARKALIEYCYCTQVQAVAGFCLWQLWHQAHVREALSSRFGTKPLPFGFGKDGVSFIVSINLGQRASLL